MTRYNLSLFGGMQPDLALRGDGRRHQLADGLKREFYELSSLAVWVMERKAANEPFKAPR